MGEKSVIRFDDITREERYYSATILPYLLSYNNFSGLASFEKELLDNGFISEVSGEYDNVQLITEVSLERDLSFAKIEIPSSAFEKKLDKQTKPDLLIITDKSFYVIECKVFLNESEYKLHRQILEQKYILDIVENVAQRNFINKQHILMIPFEYDIPDCAVITWERMFDVFKEVVPNGNYFLMRLEAALRRLR